MLQGTRNGHILLRLRYALNLIHMQPLELAAKTYILLTKLTTCSSLHVCGSCTHCAIIATLSLCVISASLPYLCHCHSIFSLQGSLGPAGPPGPPGAIGRPVSVFIHSALLYIVIQYCILEYSYNSQ